MTQVTDQTDGPRTATSTRISTIDGKDIKISKINDETIKIKLKVNSMGFKMWAMRNIDCVEVVKPLELRNEMKKIIEEANKKYE